MKSRQYTYFLISVSSIVFVGIVWQVIASSGIIGSFFLPSPTKVTSALIQLFIEGDLLKDIGMSILRIILGFLLSVAFALPMGILLGMSQKSKAFFEPMIAFVRYVPPSAFIPLIIVWFGVGEVGKVFLIFLGVGPYLALLVMDTVFQLKKELIESAIMLGANNWDVIFKVIIPSSMPSFWDSFRIMFGAAWTFVIIAEIIGSSSGLGHTMIEAQRFLRTDTIFAVIIIIGTLGICTDYAFKIIGKLLFPWNKKNYASD